MDAANKKGALTMIRFLEKNDIPDVQESRHLKRLPRPYINGTENFTHI